VDLSDSLKLLTTNHLRISNPELMDGITKINHNVTFQPDYNNILKVLYNQRPDYLPLYEHHIDAPFISKVLGKEVSNAGKIGSDLEEHHRT
jgi:hypothetical protein